jgi:hypothetical protein
VYKHREKDLLNNGIVKDFMKLTGYFLELSYQIKVLMMRDLHWLVRFVEIHTQFFQKRLGRMLMLPMSFFDKLTNIGCKIN